MLTPQTEPRSPVEGQIAPSDIREFLVRPPLGLEVHGVVAVDVFAAMQVVGRDGDAASFGDEDWGAAIGAAAAGEPGGFVGETGV